MTQIKSAFTRANYLAAAGALVFAAVLAAFPAGQANALSLLDRSLMVTSTNPSDDLEAPDGTTYTGLDAGDPRNGAEVGHVYRFTTQTGTGNVPAITIQYCDAPFGWADGETCAVPDDFSASTWNGATVNVIEDPDGGSPSSEPWTVAYTANGNVGQVLTLTEPGGGTSHTFGSGDTYEIDFTAALVTGSRYFVNPSSDYFTSVSATQPPTYFAHIATHDGAPTLTDNGTLDDTYVDDGTVTNNITESISIYTRVQETLNFSVEGEQLPDTDGSWGPTGGIYSGTGVCTPLDPTDPDKSTLLRMGDANFALSASQEYTVDSYFRLATNSSNGVSVYYSGDTLESGADFIEAIANGGAASDPGNEQFGLALVTDGDLETDRWTQFTDLSAVGAYGDHTTAYAYDETSVTAPREIANANGIVKCDTGHLRYVANIAEDTPAGIYTTKINYIASPAY